MFRSFYKCNFFFFLGGGGFAVVHKCSTRFKEQSLLCTLVLSHNICIFWNLHVVSVTFRTHFITTVTMKICIPISIKRPVSFCGDVMGGGASIQISSSKSRISRFSVLLSKLNTFCIYGYQL